MKLTIILTAVIFTMAFSSCNKCETCVPYYYDSTTSTIGAVDTGGGGAQALKLCDKTDIKAYESLSGFKDGLGHQVKFICQ